jgi:5-methylcytosine-specific restriction endonuclease McrA
MAGYRQIHTQIWKDEWFLDLDPREKLLFIYLFSNDQSTVSGIYRISRRVIVFETGLDEKFIDKALEKFAKAGKVFTEDCIVWVVNLRKYNESSSPKVRERIARDIEDLPDGRIKEMYIEYLPIDRPTQEELTAASRRGKRPVYVPETSRQNYTPGSRSSQTNVRNRLLKERGERCEWCGNEGYVELHHIIPVRAGGTLNNDNCLLLCQSCHGKANAEANQKYGLSESDDAEIPSFPGNSEHRTENIEHEIEQEHEQKHSTPPDGGGVCDKAHKDKVRGNLETYFSRRSGLDVPKRATVKQKAAAAELWWSPLREIAELAGWDEDAGMRLISDTLAEMQGQNLRVIAPKSILNVAKSIHAEKNRVEERVVRFAV